MFFKIFIQNYEKIIFTDSIIEKTLYVLNLISRNSLHYIRKINNHLIILLALYIARYQIERI